MTQPMTGNLEPRRRPWQRTDRIATAAGWFAALLVLVNVGGPWPHPTVVLTAGLALISLTGFAGRVVREERRLRADLARLVAWDRLRAEFDRVPPGRAVASCAVMHPDTRDAVGRASIHSTNPQPIEVYGGLRIFVSPLVEPGQIVVLDRDGVERLSPNGRERRGNR